jgi:hypothetical protein
MNYSAYSDPTFSFKEEEIDLLLKSLSFEILDLNERQSWGFEEKVEKLSALRNKLKYENAGCG